MFANASKSVWLLIGSQFAQQGGGLTPVTVGSAVAVSSTGLLTSCDNIQGADAVGIKKAETVQRVVQHGPISPSGICVLVVTGPLPVRCRRACTTT